MGLTPPVCFRYCGFIALTGLPTRERKTIWKSALETGKLGGTPRTDPGPDVALFEVASAFYFQYMDNAHLEHRRHSLAHLLAAAVLELYPDAKRTIGPAIEDGFYYDFEFSSPITDADLPKIEAKMRELLPSWTKFEGKDVTVDEARAFFADNPYKLELIEEHKDAGLTFYTSGNYTDLCRGGHAEGLAGIDPDSFKLTRLAGAYWRGDEKNIQLTRIYGVAFETKAELEAYLAMLEEAKKRDHRKLGKELELFTFSDIVGSGLPIWLPKGATVRRVLERFIVDTELKWGYQHVYTPDIAKLDLYKKSGHYPYYKESMYAPIKIDEDEFMLRPMTCPHHFQVYADRPRSYRELPMRIAELAKLYRYEASGELSGLVRVRSFCLADAHIVCAGKEQAIEEVGRALDLIEYVASAFGLQIGKDYWYRLSLGDRNNEKKYYKNDQAWEDAEAMLRVLLENRECKFVEATDEAAFYGPKIDIQMKDVRGKENTAFTVQYDFCMPDRFDLTYIDQDNQEKRAIVVHRSSIGAIERVMAFIIEHFAGAFPMWLAPEQIRIASVADDYVDAAKAMKAKLEEAGLRVALDDSSEKVGKKIRDAAMQKVPWTIVVGAKEKDGGDIQVKVFGSEAPLVIPQSELVVKVLEAAKLP